MKRIALGITLALAGASVNAAELSKDIEVGMYGSIGYKDYKDQDIDTYFTSNNVYAELSFGKLKFMVDANGQFDQLNFQEGESTDSENYELYQGYVSYAFNRSHQFKAGRIASLNFKGENSLDVKSSIIDTTAPIKIFGHSNYQHIDGASYTYSMALNKGQFDLTVYGGNNYLRGSNEDEYEGDKITSILSFHKNGHRFLTGIDSGSFSDKEDGENTLSVDELDYENIYFTYQFENKKMFIDSTYVISNYDDNDLIKDTKRIDTKIGTKMGTKNVSLKPFFGYNQLEVEDSTIDTITYGLRYDYKSLGIILSKSEISGDRYDYATIDNLSSVSAADITDYDEEIWEAKIIYNF